MNCKEKIDKVLMDVQKPTRYIGNEYPLKLLNSELDSLQSCIAKVIISKIPHIDIQSGNDRKYTKEIKNIIVLNNRFLQFFITKCALNRKQIIPKTKNTKYLAALSTNNGLTVMVNCDVMGKSEAFSRFSASAIIKINNKAKLFLQAIL